MKQFTDNDLSVDISCIDRKIISSAKVIMISIKDKFNEVVDKPAIVSDNGRKATTHLSPKDFEKLTHGVAKMEATIIDSSGNVHKTPTEKIKIEQSVSNKFLVNKPHKGSLDDYKPQKPGNNEDDIEYLGCSKDMYWSSL